ncbi:MAG: sugar isomerase, partial [Candidatus Hydrogenedentes bacterium]|nr:sugar isomerase [Candidatus Hydrogenedentota bacterium]
MHEHKPHTACCGSYLTPMERRKFLSALGATAGVTAMAGCATTAAKPGGLAGARPKPSLEKKPLVVQPVLAYHIYKRREQTSWRPWGGLHTEADVAAEVKRIESELQGVSNEAEFPLSFKPLARVRNDAEAKALRDQPADLMLIYGATAGVSVMENLISPDRYNVVFVRHKSGPVYLWYEIVHPRLLRKTVDEYGQPGLETCDVVVDEYGDLLWRLRSLYALKNTVGSRVVCVGGPSGWGAGGQKAPEIAANLWKMDLVDEPYEDLGVRIKAARADAERVRRAEAEAAAYLDTPGTQLKTDVGFVNRAFLLTDIFKEIMAEADAHAITVNHCMSTIIPMAETTACLPFSLINDSGAMAFCESDFAVIPSGVLLHHIASTPVFLQDPTYPHHGVVTLAHCTAPRKMDGKQLEEALIVTHYESDYGAAPKVNMHIGQNVTVLNPDFHEEKWIGFRGTIQDHPFLDICRSQVDVAIEGDCDRLVRDMRGFHWMLAYGNHLKETGYALRKLGIEWYNLSDDKTMET